MRSFFRQMRTYLYAGVFLFSRFLWYTALCTERNRRRSGYRHHRGFRQGCHVSLLNTDTQVELTTISSPTGSFILPPVKPGHYKVVVTSAGFEPWVDNEITLEIGEDKDVSAILHVGTVNQRRDRERCARRIAD